jgi:Domain of unknown function (DUF3303)
MHYLVIEHFRNRDPVPVYRRLADQGRLIPDGLEFVSSWITEDLSRCYQVMKADELRFLEQWMAQWSDLVDFEVLPVLSSQQVQERLASRT